MGGSVIYYRYCFMKCLGRRLVKIQQMHQAITKLYARLATRMVRNPRSEKWRPLLPRAIFSTDLPIRKNSEASFDNDITNDGLHMHGIILAHPDARITDLEEHLLTNQDVYRIAGIRNVDVQRIKSSPGYTTDYALKGLKRADLGLDDVLVFPRVLNELSGLPQSDSGCRHIKDLQSAFNFSDELAQQICADRVVPEAGEASSKSGWTVRASGNNANGPLSAPEVTRVIASAHRQTCIALRETARQRPKPPGVRFSLPTIALHYYV